MVWLQLKKTAPKRKGDEPAFERLSFLGEPGLFVFRGEFCSEDSSIGLQVLCGLSLVVMRTARILSL